jgi:two-component system, OmpR family, response regulator
MRKKPRGLVMVVDDDEIVLEVTRERLQRMGFEVVTRKSAIGTVVASQQEQPDFLLVDVNMPALGGKTLAKLIGASSPRPAVILYSSLSRQQLRVMAAEVDAIGAVEKTQSESSFISQFEECVLIASRRGRD